MNDTSPDDSGLAPSAQAFEQAIAAAPDARFVLRLYVSGMTARSRQAIENIWPGGTNCKSSTSTSSPA